MKPSCLGIYKYQTILSRVLWKFKKMKSDKNLIFADIVYFGLIYTSEKKRKIQTGENHVHQGLSKVFVFYTYSRHYFVIPGLYFMWLRFHPLMDIHSDIVKFVNKNNIYKNFEPIWRRQIGKNRPYALEKRLDYEVSMYYISR